MGGRAVASTYLVGSGSNGREVYGGPNRPELTRLTGSKLGARLLQPQR